MKKIYEFFDTQKFNWPGFIIVSLEKITQINNNNYA